MESNISLSSQVFQRDFNCAHITALKAYNDLLFVAQGNEIQIYEWSVWFTNEFNGERVLKLRRDIFDDCAIHGIRCADDYEGKFLFFGAKQIKTFFFPDFALRGVLSEVINLKDWILDVQWISQPEKNDYIIAALTAHNSLVLLKETGDIIQTYHCAENCIVYSASIISCEYNSLVLAVGTVFQKILIWSPFSNQNDVNRKEPFHQLSGHQGVIFSVTYNDNHKIICSTSDDRSLRIWKVQNKNQFASSSLEFWENSTIEAIHVLYAHESRVWRSVILDTCIISIGEDSIICVWNLEGKLLKKFKGHHANGSIWCIETSDQGYFLNQKNSSPVKQENPKQYIAFTGGSDGGVYIWNINEAQQFIKVSQLSKESQVFESHINKLNADINLNATKSTNLKRKESYFPKEVSLYMEENEANILVYMGSKEISMFNLKSKSYEDVFSDPSIADYCILTSCVAFPKGEHGEMVKALGTYDGQLILLHMKDLCNKKPGHQKKFLIHHGGDPVYSLHWCNYAGDILLSCGTQGHMYLWKVFYRKKEPGGEDEEFEIQCLQHFFLPKCKNRWRSTAALYLDSQSLIVGDRGGSIYAYNFSDNLDENNWTKHDSVHRNIHGDNGVTDIQHDYPFIYSSGRDGKVNRYILSEGELILHHALKVSHDLEWVGRILLYKSPYTVFGHTLLAGFHSNNFVVWSCHLETPVMTVECGGGHRSWDFNLSSEGIATFTAIQKKDVIYCQQSLYHILEESVVKNGITGQKICCLTYLFHYKIPNVVTMSVFVCGGEDNTLRAIALIDLDEKQPLIVPYSKVSGHLSNIRAIGKQKLVDGEKGWILASVGGRSQIIIWRVGVFCSKVTFEKLFSKQLLGSCGKSKSKSKENTSVESQTRLMDVSVSYGNNHGCFDIAVACSDSYLRLYEFDKESRKLDHKYTLKHDENCILKIASEPLGYSAASQDITYITGATSGSLKILQHDKSLPGVLNVVKDMKNSHKSGINALDIKYLFAAVWMICSGGDDNSLMVAFINMNSLPSIKSDVSCISKLHQLNAHASQITGVKILDPFTIVSTSIDQRLNVWKLYYTNSPTATVEIKLHKSIISLIPDIADLECWKYKSLSIPFLQIEKCY